MRRSSPPTDEAYLSAPRVPRRRGLAALVVGLVPLTTWAYGPLGHRIAGLAAEPLLCGAARAEIRSLAGNDSLDELGLWADRIRSDPSYAESAPWHYMNLADTSSVEAYAHPSEGDILWAIGHFAAVLADRGEPEAARRDALAFLVHFVIDIHQPLHVGRAADRGGNTIEFRFQGEPTNLHRFWDTQAIRLGDRTLERYAGDLLEDAGLAANGAIGTPTDWARESFELRAAVYAFSSPATIAPDYVRRAQRITRERLALAAWRLAGTLNSLFCP